MIVHKLNMEWAESCWADPLTGIDVMCLSPSNMKSHFRNNYFRLNMFTGDVKYAVFVEFESIKYGREIGKKWLWARNLITGELINLGEIPVVTSWMSYAVA